MKNKQFCPVCRKEDYIVILNGVISCPNGHTLQSRNPVKSAKCFICGIKVPIEEALVITDKVFCSDSCYREFIVRKYD